MKQFQHARRVKRVVICDNNMKNERRAVEFTVTLYSYAEPWEKFGIQYGLRSDMDVAEEVANGLQVDAWSDVFNGLEPMAVIEKKLKEMEEENRKNLMKIHKEEQGKND